MNATKLAAVRESAWGDNRAEGLDSGKVRVRLFFRPGRPASYGGDWDLEIADHTGRDRLAQVKTFASRENADEAFEASLKQFGLVEVDHVA